ncbi:MAG: flavin monoamine oxidase family protein [Pirellulaceae bacterium]|nr:flavin monoamine oxidase family protein [Pirellulaceae bacterium]
MPQSAEVIVVGAGYAGLSAADQLLKQGIRPLVIEARSRIGGRTHTAVTNQGLWVDLGGQWIGPGQDCMYALAKRFDRRVWPMYVAGRQVVELAGKVKSYRGLIPMNLPPLALANLLWGFQRLEWLARRVPLEQPWAAKGAAALDQRTVGDWLRSNVRQRQARALMQVAIEAVFAAHPDDVGLLHALYYLRSGGGLERLTSSAGGAQQDRVDGGMQRLAEDWRSWLEVRGIEFRLDVPVRSITQDATGVVLFTDTETLSAGHSIVTVPPAVAAEIEMTPAMPSARLSWCRAMTPGRVIKGFAIYERPFWRQRGLCGQAVSDQAPVHVTFDATPPDSSQGILLGFIEGRTALQWSGRSQDDRRQAMIEAFARLFGPEAARPIDYVDHDWTQETWSRGCYAGVAGPGVTTTVASAARPPHGRIHWAGTETATQWCGYIEGAIRSGIRAAQEIQRV